MAKDIDISSWSKEDQERYHELSNKVLYYDQLQYIFKIKLNSLYGALLNKHFRFYDERLGESTTGTGRAILRYQCSRVNELLTGEYNDTGDAILYGDTDSTYFSAMYGKTPPENFEEHLTQAIESADSIAQQVNDSFPAFMERAFLCRPEYKGMVKCAREVVAPRGIFVTPKRYVLWLADLDGKRVDKLKVMGLDTKKTILPKYIQTALNDFIERYLKGESWDSLAEDIVDYKDKLLRERPPTDLGLPKGVNKLELYKAEYDLHGEGVRLPGHVRAAIYYNKLLEENDDKISMEITSGMKIKIFYLKRPVGKFKSVAFPVDEDRVPEWFTKLNIDYELQVAKLVDAPLLNILKAIGKRPPSQQSIFEESILDF